MRIYVPSRKRTAPKLMFGSYTPMRWLTPSLLKRTSYVVRDDEVDTYNLVLRRSQDLHGGPDVLGIGMPENLSTKRDYIAAHVSKHGEEKFLMTDDDVMLYVRKSPDAFNLRYPLGNEVDDLIKGIEDLLDTYPMVGVSSREGNNTAGNGPWPMIRECGRSMRFYAFRTRDYLAIRPNRLPEMADFDTTLQFLERGQKNAVIYYWANGQPGSQVRGGCSIYRTSETHDQVCRQLQTLHPDYVKLRTKTNKGHQHGFGTRTEVTVQWKKAYEHACHQST